MKLTTSRFNDCLGILGMAVSKNVTDRPITKTINLYTEDNYLYGVTINNSNNIRMRICETTEDFNVTVQYDLLNNIIKACEDEFVELTSSDKSIQIKSNLIKCKLPIFTYQGNFPKPKTNTAHSTDFSTLSQYNAKIKSVLNKDCPVNCYKNIYFSDTDFMVTDTDNVLLVNEKYFNEPLLLDVSTVDILSNLAECNYSIETKVMKNIQGKILTVVSDDIELNAISQSFDEYQYDDFKTLFDTTIKDKTDISKGNITKAITVASLFNDTPTLNFTNKGIFISIKESDFSYKISDEVCTNEVSYKIPIALFRKITTSNSDIITISYGNTDMIKCEEDTVQVVYAVEVG